MKNKIIFRAEYLNANHIISSPHPPLHEVPRRQKKMAYFFVVIIRSNVHLGDGIHMINA